MAIKSKLKIRSKSCLSFLISTKNVLKETLLSTFIFELEALKLFCDNLPPKNNFLRPKVQFLTMYVPHYKK